MKQGLSSIQRLAEVIEANEAAKADFIADTRHMTMTPRPADDGLPAGLSLTIAEAQSNMPVLAHAHSQIGARLGIPTKYYRRMEADAPQLLADNVNHWFRQKPERRMVRSLYGDARAFLSDRYCRIDNHQVAEAVLPVVMELAGDMGLKLTSCDVTESRLYIKLVTERIRAEVSVGDEVQQGIVISNSEIGMGALNIAPMVFRLVCLNGMIMGQALRKYHVGARADEELHGLLSDDTRKLEDAATLGKVRDVTRACLDGTIFNQNVEAMRGAREDKIEGDPVKAVEILGKTIGATEGETQGILRHFIQGGELTRYGALNAVTAFAQDESLTYDRATELEAAGGKVLTLKRSDWREIALAA